ncbi:MAG: lysophospholipase [Rubrobacteraceae bacterium]|jgi:acylglycerol lipase
MRQGTGAFAGSGGVTLFERWWRPDGPVRATVILIHGLKDHSARYTHVAESLAGSGYAVYAFDLRGHGMSEGERYFTRSFDEYVDDTKVFYSRTREREPENPIFLFGHSMGGLISCLYAIGQDCGLSGLVLSAPALEPGPGVSPVLIHLARILGRVLPRAPVVKLDVEKISRGPEVVRAAREDPLSDHRPSPARLGSEMLRAMRIVRERAKEIPLPVLVMHGTTDELASPAGSEWLHERVASTDKTLRLYEGLYHEILNEPEKEQVLTDLLRWLDARV